MKLSILVQWVGCGATHRGRSGLAVWFASALAVAAACSTATVTGIPTAAPTAATDGGSAAAIFRELLPPGAKEFDESAFEQLLGRDGIKPIYRPEIGTQQEVQLEGADLVLGVSVGGESRAYPVSTMRFKEIVNDELGGVALLVTWCQLCYTGMAHDRRVDDEVLIFGNQGALYMMAMTWWDHKTRNVWSQPWGAAISGPLEGAALTLIPSSVVPWSTWVADHPETTVLMNILDRERLRVQVSRDDFVVGVALGDGAMAYPYELASRSRVINDRIGEHPVAVFVDPAARDIRVFLRRPVGAPAGGPVVSVLAFEVDGAGRVHDRETASLWDTVKGVATEGPLKGTRFQEVPYTTAFDWAWRDFFPHSGYYGDEG